MKIFFLSILLIAVTIASAQTQPKMPNVLFIIVDQLRYDALTIAGNQVVKTPNIDRIGRQCVYFKNHYTPMAVCAPARAAPLTAERLSIPE
jgi:arylsulfatase A-like enzyme